MLVHPTSSYSFSEPLEVVGLDLPLIPGEQPVGLSPTGTSASQVMCPHAEILLETTYAIMAVAPADAGIAVPARANTVLAGGGPVES